MKPIKVILFNLIRSKREVEFNMIFNENPDVFCSIFISDMINLAIEYGNRDIVDNLLPYSSFTTVDHLAYHAALGGQKEILSYLINLGYNDWELIAGAAAKGGHRTIVMTMIRGFKDKDGNIVRAKDYNYIAEEAYDGNHEDIVSEMLGYGAMNMVEVR